MRSRIISSVRKINQRHLRGAALAMPILACAVAHADNIHWIVADGSWDKDANWNTHVPGPADFANIDAATLGATAHVVSQVPDVNGIFVLNGNVVSVDSGGSINVATAASTDSTIGLRVGDGFGGPANSNGTLLVNGGRITTTGTDAAASVRFGVTGGIGGTAGHGFVVQNGSTSFLEGQ